MIVLYVSFPEPAGIIPNLLLVPTIDLRVVVIVPSPPTTYIMFSVSLYSSAICAVV